MSEDFDLIKQSIEDTPCQWKLDKYTITNETKGIRIWIANTVFDIEPYGSAILFKFNIIDKFRFKKVIKKLRMHKLKKAMEDNP